MNSKEMREQMGLSPRSSESPIKLERGKLTLGTMSPAQGLAFMARKGAARASSGAASEPTTELDAAIQRLIAIAHGSGDPMLIAAVDDVTRLYQAAPAKPVAASSSTGSRTAFGPWKRFA